jgi:branched-subunit amino acid aminotransferase/4-amino-4-deoxychorismate lyase
VLKELAGRLGIAFTSREMTADEFAHAAEAFLTSTPNCLLPVT